MRKLATIETIKVIHPHPNADALELATVRGWQCVVKKGEFKAGDRCVYMEIDSILPEREEFEFMLTRNFRVKTAKFRGELSQGIVFPMTILPYHLAITEWMDGDDVTEELGIKLYAPPIPACLSGDVKGRFPSSIPKTDCERIQNHLWLFDLKDIVWSATEKLDGSSITVWFDNGLHVCSRNLELKETDNNAYWKASRLMVLEEKLKDSRVALQGELLGPSIQGNRYGLKDYRIFFFDAWMMDEKKYLNVDDFFLLCNDLELPTVPKVDEYSVLPKLNELLRHAEGRSWISPVEREGLVFKPKVEMNERKMGRVAFKVISNWYLLKEV